MPPARLGPAMRALPQLRRRGMTLVEVILAIVILSGTMLGLGNFARKFQSSNSGSTSKALASDLAAQRIADVLAYRPYSSIVSTYNGTSESYTTGVFAGLTRATSAVRCSGCPTATTDYITVTVSVSGNDLSTAVTKTVVVAAF
ncbi:MAG: prepilin-type N-terminal cleavage/methylation domain-containing protein [Gemmatimonadota bacterium]|nr:prepilin-type N-terminal cleavage/methylation domain-containing protein [Gemmatimonadota bacterium]